MFINIYLSPPFDAVLLYTIHEKLALFQVAKLVIAGDFNAILEKDLDASNPFQPPKPELSNWASALTLSEIW